MLFDVLVFICVGVNPAGTRHEALKQNHIQFWPACTLTHYDYRMLDCILGHCAKLIRGKIALGMKELYVHCLYTVCLPKP